MALLHRKVDAIYLQITSIPASLELCAVALISITPPQTPHLLEVFL
jgi:hypothetical protein